MAWAYCTKCDQDLKYPTVSQILQEEPYECPACGLDNDPRLTINDLIKDLIERVEKLEGTKSFDGY